MTTLFPHPGGGMFDLDSVSDAELGAIFRMQLKKRMAEKVQAATPQVVAQRAKAEAEHASHIADRQAERSSQIIPGFMVGSHLVPDLDLTNVTDLHEVVSAKQRSAYNKALYRLKMELLDPETATYSKLLDLHVSLRVLSESQPKSQPTKKGKKSGKKAAKVNAVLAETEPDKAAALAELLGISKKEARKLVDA